MRGLYRFYGFVGCFLAAVLCLREAGIRIDPVWSGPPWVNIVLAVSFLFAGLRILGGGTER